jgi:alcohol dehydrogenase class IV
MFVDTGIRHWSFASSSQLAFGWGAIRELSQAVRRGNWQRVLIVTDPVIAQLPCTQTVIEQLQSAGAQTVLFREGVPEPAVETARTAIAAAREFQPDAILGLGGGSNLDLAKITAVVTCHGGQPEDYFGFDKVPGPICPLVAIPTTAGTGSEVSHSAVLTDPSNAVKVSTQSRYLRPLLAIVDPEFTLSCPRKVTADSGIDALTHAVEGYLATRAADLDLPLHEPFAYEGKNPLGDVLAEKAIRLIAQALPGAVEQPQNRQAREQMALAATLAGLAFSNSGVALVHAMEYPIGGAVHCTHGEGNGLLLPHVMRFLLPVRTQELAEIASFLGVNTVNMSLEAAANAAIEAVDTLRERIGVPGQLRQLHVTSGHLPQFAAKAAAITRLMKLTPRRPTEADILELYQGAL